MNKKIIFPALLAIVLIIAVFVSFNSKKTSISAPLTTQSLTKPGPEEKIVPSKTLKTYSDPSGFAFNYPDNLSITNNEITDKSTYSDIQLFAKGVNGSLSLKIADTKFKTLDEWVEKNAFTQTPKETKLGSLKALEVKTSDRLLLASLDQGILFTVEVPLVEESFWMEVYSRILSEFNFIQPQQEATLQQGSNVSDVSFEGEEVVE